MHKEILNTISDMFSYALILQLSLTCLISKISLCSTLVTSNQTNKMFIG